MLIDFTERGREGEKEGEKHECEKHRSVASHTCPDQGPNLQPRHVPWLGTEPTTFQSTGWCSNNWATPARAKNVFKEYAIWYWYRNQFLYQRKSINSSGLLKNASAFFALDLGHFTGSFSICALCGGGCGWRLNALSALQPSGDSASSHHF